jgi:hypothetical protein
VGSTGRKKSANDTNEPYRHCQRSEAIQCKG